MQNNYVNVRFNKNNGTYTAFVDIRGRVKKAGQWKNVVIRRETNSTFTCPHLAAAWREYWLDSNTDVKATRNEVPEEYRKAYRELMSSVEEAARAKAIEEAARYIQPRPDEMWKDVQGYEGLYKISNRGRAASVRPGGLVEVGTPGSRNEYPRVGLSKPGTKTKTVFIHRLVAEAFCYNACPATRTQVDHIDADRANNHFENLRWCSPQENSKFAVQQGKPPFGKKRAPVPVKDSLGNYFPSQSAAARYHKISQAAVAHILSATLPLQSIQGVSFTRVDEAATNVP